MNEIKEYTEKLFEDINCTKELNVDLFDCYVTTVQVINGINDIVFKRNIKRFITALYFFAILQ